MEEIEALHILSHMPKGRQLLSAHKSATEALLDPLAASWEKLNSWKEDLALVKSHGITLIAHNDPRYPKALREASDFPLILYVKGELLPLDHSSIAIIGTEECSLFAKDTTRKIAQELAEKGVTITSTLERGINTAAHLGALLSGRTVSILNSGFAQINSSDTLALTSHITHKGAVVSEFPMNMAQKQIPINRRSRLLHFFSEVLLVTETSTKSPSLKLASSFEKPCFAFSGLANAEFLAIKKAILVQNVQEILSFLYSNNLKSWKDLHPSSSFSLKQD